MFVSIEGEGTHSGSCSLANVVAFMAAYGGGQRRVIVAAAVSLAPMCPCVCAS